MNLTSKFLSVAASAILTVGMTGCEDTTSKSTSTSQVKVIGDPKGSVTGLVQDTNGNPLEGATVYLAGESTTTDAGGVYRFDNVPVVGTTGMDDEEDPHYNQLSVTIVPPAGYIGATVTVSPLAQIDGAEGTESDVASTTNGAETFVDGYLASAGTAVLPDTNSSVTGILRDNATGEKLANTEMKFEFEAGGTWGVAQEQNQDGVDTTYAVDTYTISTDENGSFSFASLPSDSHYSIIVPGYVVNTINGNNTTNFSSDDEDKITLGNVTATKILALDEENPFVVSVNGVLADAARAVLNDDTRNTFVVNFSETLDASELELAGNSVLLYAGEAGELSKIDHVATIDAANKTITITTTTVLNDGDNVDILFLNSDTMDTSGNTIALNGDISYDDNAIANYTRLKLEIFSEANTNAEAATAESQLTVDTSGDNDDDIVQAKSDAFNDVLDESASFQQLNSADDDDTSGTADSEERLSDLAAALGATGVETDKTRITFTPNNAYAYLVAVTDDSGVAKVQGNVFALANAISSNIDTTDGSDFGGTATAMLVPTDINPVEIYLDNVEPTDIVTITPIDSLGYVGTAVTVTLADNVAPTTILQKSYFSGVATSGEDGTNTVVQFGDGGELADTNGAVTVGTPYIAINNSLLDNEDASGESVSTGVNPDETLSTELYDLGVIDTDGTGDIYLDGQAAYDAQAIAAFTDLSRKIGVSFSEDIASFTTPSFTGSVALSGWEINNDVVSNVSGQVVNADLLDVNVANVISLANDDHLEVIDFTGITDEAGNTASAATNAKVVVKDEMAPLVVSATYTETSANVVITFNEPIMLTDSAVAPAVNSVVTINGITATYDSAADAEDQWTLSSGDTVLTIPQSAFAGTINSQTVWNTGIAFAYPNDNYSMGTTTDMQHLLLDFSAISDVQENSWDSYSTKTVGRTVENPLFAIAQRESGFAPNSNPTVDLTDALTVTKTATWTLNHPVRIDNVADTFNGITPNTSGDYVLDGGTPADLAKINDLFIGNGGETITDAGTDTSLTLSADRKTLTLVFRLSANITAPGNVQLNTDVLTSDGDITDFLATTELTVDAQ